ncbi:MAG: hydrogen gas-evolving membrane-bound hydrogenase subunit E, partial [Ilumatobacteraceae bacterium]
GLDIAIDLRLDAFALLMVAIVSGIGLLICIYALGYFAPHDTGDTHHTVGAHHTGAAGVIDTGVARLAGMLTLFAGAMLGVVLSDQLIGLFVFWELTSITSYLLIGNDDTIPRARAAALQALFITGGGGLAMLAGLIMIGEAGGTYRISELAAQPPSGSIVNAAIVLVLVGAFTKSAQAPFSSWLPGAMVAPTPVSAYLHSATMVKAGVYLVARLAPIFALTGQWRLLVLIVGAVTMMLGGLRALRQNDLKLLLAYGTISQLGFMMLLFGVGGYQLAEAGMVLLLAHAAFKAALFMVVGVVDHGAGTRDVRRLHGFGGDWRLVQIVAVISAASMAGIPPLLGFIAKEKALEGYIEQGDFVGAGAVLTVIVAASMLTFAYSARFVLGVFGRLGQVGEHDVSSTAHAPGLVFIGPAALLSAFTVVAGLVPSTINTLVEGATVALYPGTNPAPVVLWSGFNEAVLLSLVIIAGGIAITWFRSPVAAAQRRFSDATHVVPTGDRAFLGVLRGIGVTARRVTGVVQNGSLPIYIGVIMLVGVVVPLIPMATDWDGVPRLVERPAHVALVAIMLSAALGACMVGHRIAAVLMLSAVGYAMSALYVVQGAPDLALTQFAIETLSTVLFVLVLRFLPRTWSHGPPARGRPARIAVALVVGVGMFVFAIVSSQARSDVDGPSTAAAMIEGSEPLGKGSNVVNVILVDFRGWDTMGEITVLLVAAVGAVSLARAGRRRSDRSAPVFEEVVE